MEHHTRFYWFDLIRGLSAITVCAGHLRAALFVDFNEVEAPSYFQRFFYFITGLGHQAVLVFFVLSGFFIGGSILKKRDTFTWFDYSISRITRLWIVLIPALIFTRIIDFVIYTVNPTTFSGAFQGIWSSGPIPDGSYSNSFCTFLGNTLFVQTILVPTYGTNGPVWSLANEFWYYVIFPLLITCFGYFQHQRMASNRVFSAVIILLILFWIPSEFLIGFLVWLLGVFIWWLGQKTLKPSWKLSLVGFIVFASSLIYSKTDMLQSLLRINPDVVVGLGAFALIAPLVKLPFPKSPKNFLRRLSQGTSEISYSFYLFHFPVVILIAVAFYSPHQLQPNTQGFIQFTGWFTVLLLGGTMFWCLFERRTQEFRSFVINVFKSING